MDIDQNDLLSTNIYITKPNLNPNISIDSVDEFRSYYENEMKLQDESKIKSKINFIEHNELEDDNNNYNINAFNSNKEVPNEKKVDRFVREQKTLVSIDSRDRIKTQFLKPNNFSIFLGKTFANVRKIEMVSLEFPNTNAIINSNNNTIYWRNQEDIDLDITVTTKNVINYPIYSVNLRIGSYTVSTLQTEIMNSLNLVRRKKGKSNGNTVTGDYHYFVVSLDIDTDVVSFTSLILEQLPNNPFSTSIGSGVITVSAPNHGYSTYDYIYFMGAKAVAGISATNFIGFQEITVINDNVFTFQLTIKAGDTISGGGNTIKSGKKSGFQLLWGESNYGIAQNIGFPMENSSQLISTNILSLQNIFQMNINTLLPHNFLQSYLFIGNTINIGYLSNNTDFVSKYTFIITNITGTNSILVQISDNSIVNTLINNSQATLLRFGTNIFTIDFVSVFITNSFLVTTQTNHNYNLNNINNQIQLSNTLNPNVLNTISYDGNYIIQSIPSSTTIILPGILGITSSSFGGIPRQNPLTSLSLKISDIIPNVLTLNGLNYTKFITISNHNLNVGDNIFINNVLSIPVLNTSYQIATIINSTSFLIQISLSNIVINSNSYIGTGLITVSYPLHNFNKITSITNGILYQTISGNTNTITLPLIIQTFNPHNLVTGKTIRLSGTNTTPNIDGGGYIVTVIDNNNFSIINPNNSFRTLTNIPTIITGILGLSNDFFIYGSTDVGGILKTIINGTKFTVRDIIDINTFTFMINNTFSSNTEIGGGNAVYISSLKQGFNGIQTNTKNNVLNRSINLQGENYCFLTCPQLNTMLNTGKVTNIFSRLSLNKPPGYICFDFLSNPKQFNTIPLTKLSTLDFSVVTYDNILFDFQDLDFSFCLEVTEVSDATHSFNTSSRRGITDIS